MTCFEKWTLSFQGLGILATLLLAAIAIWGEKLRQIWNKPKLEIHLDSPSLTKTGKGRKGWYYLIKASNLKLSSPAKNG